MYRASLRLYRQGAHARHRARDPATPSGLPALRGAVRFRSALSQVRARPHEGAGRTTRIEAADPAGVVRRVKWLTRDGLVAALAVGGAVVAGFGWRGVVVLFAFFISGSALTQLAGGADGARTARQVLANGGVAALA